MEPKPFRRHKTERANNHIEQGNALIFARHPIGVSYNQLIAMLTDAIHTFSHIASLGMLSAYQTLDWRGVLERMVCQPVNLLYADC
jgi:hypothetical protein